MPTIKETDALSSVLERQRRLDSLADRHVKPLTDYLDVVRTEVNASTKTPLSIPNFDPSDGGVYARALFLLEAPGPQAIKSGFVSRDNPDPTARNLYTLMQKAGILRTDTLLWNIVPWYVGEQGRIRPVDRTDVAQALPYLESLLHLLHNLEVIVLIGRKAQTVVEPLRRMTSVRIEQTFHMSARVCNVWHEKKQHIQETFESVGQRLHDQDKQV